MNEDAAPAAQSEFARLGAGGRDDRLHFRLVLRILGRALRLLRDVRGHVAVLAAGSTLLAVAAFAVGMLVIDIWWSRVLQGHPPTQVEAVLLRLDPGLASLPSDSVLPEDLRRSMARRCVVVAIAFAAVLSPLFLGLFYYQVWILQRVNQLLRLRLHEQLQTLSLRFHSDQRVGDSIYRLYQDSAMVTQTIDLLILRPAAAGARFVFGFVVVLLLDPLLGVVLLTSLPPCLLLAAWLSRPMRVGFRAAREANAALTSRIQEVLAGIKVIKAFGAEEREQARFEAESRSAFAAAFGARNRFAFYGVALFWAIALPEIAGAALAAWRTQAGSALFAQSLLVPFGFTVWNLGLYNVLKARFADGVENLRFLLRTWGQGQDVAIGLDRVFEILDLEREVQDAPDAVELPGVRRVVRFRGVGFAYEPGRDILEDVSFEAPVGSVTAIVGPTGSGKSTLMALLLRLFDPSRGAIEIDGVDLRRFKVESLRSRVAIALQENLLFGDTVRENIRYAVPNASDAAVREAARVACADAFIEALPEGFDTPLGERGTKLSTGQRQRLSIARAVLKDAPILLLDEPTASLDAETEHRVLTNLAEWGRDRAIFLVTHRLSTIRRADRILVLEGGRLVEQGSHDELLARSGGVYRKLVELEDAGAGERARASA
jgi:ABC-type multidrug transport system fused ATPase/permease subunit